MFKFVFATVITVTVLFILRVRKQKHENFVNPSLKTNMFSSGCSLPFPVLSYIDFTSK